MASEDSSFDLQSLLADAQDLVDESFVARALLQPDNNPWESFPFGFLYPTEEPFNEIHYSLVCDPATTSLPATEPTIKTEPAEDTPLFQPIPEYPCEDALTDLFLTHEACVHEDLDSTYPNTNHSPASVSPSTSSKEPAALLQPEPELADYLYLPDQLDYPTTPAIVDSSSFSAISLSPTTTVSPSSSFSLSGPSYVDTNNSQISEYLKYSNVALDKDKYANPPAVNHDGPLLEEPSVNVHYTFVNPHEKPRKRRAKGIKNSTPIACTFCRRRKIRCGGPQEGDGVCKSCIRLNHKGDCFFPAVSYRGQRLGGSNSSSKRKSTSKSKSTAKCVLPPSKSS